MTDHYATVDWFTDGSVVDDPYPYYRYLRDERGPVWIEPTHGVAVVTGHDEALAVYRDHETFSSCNAPIGSVPRAPRSHPRATTPARRSSSTATQMPMYGYMATWDPPQHSDYRSLLTRLFTPKRLKENEEFMWRLADRQLDEFLADGRVRVHQRVRRSRSPCSSSPTCSACPEDDHAALPRRVRHRAEVAGADRRRT